MKPVFIPSNMLGRMPVSLTTAGNTASVNKTTCSLLSTALVTELYYIIYIYYMLYHY